MLVGIEVGMLVGIEVGMLVGMDVGSKYSNLLRLSSEDPFWYAY
jgi:hypothetical protein